jgi:hypothetical protein
MSWFLRAWERHNQRLMDERLRAEASPPNQAMRKAREFVVEGRTPRAGRPRRDASADERT